MVFVRCLRELMLQSCNLREGLEPLCAVLERFDEALRPVVRVEKLSLSTNHIGPEGARPRRHDMTRQSGSI